MAARLSAYSGEGIRVQLLVGSVMGTVAVKDGKKGITLQKVDFAK